MISITALKILSFSLLFFFVSALLGISIEEMNKSLESMGFKKIVQIKKIKKILFIIAVISAIIAIVSTSIIIIFYKQGI